MSKSKAASLNHKQAKKMLKRAGFETVRDKGKHTILRHNKDKKVRQLVLSKGSSKHSVSRRHLSKAIEQVPQYTEVVGRCLDCEKELVKKAGVCPWCGSHNLSLG